MNAQEIKKKGRERGYFYDRQSMNGNGYRVWWIRDNGMSEEIAFDSADEAMEWLQGICSVPLDPEFTNPIKE
jgi:hypothetical protein